MIKNKLIKDIKDILKKTNDNNYYNTELKNKILELVKIIARENNIEYETIITYKENQNKFLNNNRVIKYYYMIFKNQQCNFGITITKSKDFLFFLLDNNLKIKSFGESSVKELFGIINNNEDIPPCNDRVLKSMQYLGFGDLK